MAEQLSTCLQSHLVKIRPKSSLYKSGISDDLSLIKQRDRDTHPDLVVRRGEQEAEVHSLNLAP